MIEELHIRGLGVIEDAQLELSPGLTVVTGETGAGKTMLVTALQLLLGARADSDLVRTGATAACVDAVFAPRPSAAVELLEVDDPDEPLIASRRIPLEGRSRAHLDGRPVPVGTLQEVLGGAVEVHAQHEHVRLAVPAVQRELLDRWAGADHQQVLSAYRSAYEHWQELHRRCERQATDERERARELDRLRFEVDEIDRAGIDLARDTQLDAELDRLLHADQLRQAAATAAAALGSEGAGEPMGVAVSALRGVPIDDPGWRELTDRVVALAEEVADLAGDVRDHGGSIEADPARLAELEDRRQLLAGLTRKYGPDLAAVVAYGQEAADRLAAAEAEEADAADLEERLAAATEQLTARAAEVRTGRQAAGAALAEVVDAHLVDLAMPHARFNVEVVALGDGAFTADGGDQVTFLLAANPGEPARPLARAASGGERSRVSLAIEVALADVDDAQVLVFDEVDAGIGGATALAVGEKLARLAGGENGRQVLCVTHLAQLAAFADVHHVVEKQLATDRTVTTTRRVADEDRVAELARMLGGDGDAEAGRAHARELLDGAAGRRAR